MYDSVVCAMFELSTCARHEKRECQNVLLPTVGHKGLKKRLLKIRQQRAFCIVLSCDHEADAST
jgi:hypothetical protein